jgi:hypothetical protein
MNAQPDLGVLGRLQARRKQHLRRLDFSQTEGDSDRCPDLAKGAHSA